MSVIRRLPDSQVSSSINKDAWAAEKVQRFEVKYADTWFGVVPLRCFPRSYPFGVAGRNGAAQSTIGSAAANPILDANPDATVLP
jgi:hypothetical protein